MIVVDANLMVVSAVKDDRREMVFQQFERWVTQGIELHAPYLAVYEVTNSLTRLAVAGTITINDAADCWNDISLLPVIYHPITNGRRVIEISIQLKRQSAYDAAYLSLAESLGAELWTLDGPLYRNASGLGLPVRLLT